MNDFYTKLFGFSIRELTDKFAALEKEQTELVSLKTEISTNLIKAERQIKRRESTPIKSVFFVNEPVEKIRDLAQSLGGGFKESKSEWKFNGYVVCDGWDPEGNIFQVRSLKSA